MPVASTRRVAACPDGIGFVSRMLIIGGACNPGGNFGIPELNLKPGPIRPADIIIGSWGKWPADPPHAQPTKGRR